VARRWASAAIDDVETTRRASSVTTTPGRTGGDSELVARRWASAAIDDVETTRRASWVTTTPGRAGGDGDPGYAREVAEQRTQANLKVDGFAVSTGTGATRLELPHAELGELRGRAGVLEYVASKLVFEGLEGRFAPLRWACDAGTVGGLVVQEPQGRFEVAIARVEFPHGLQLTRAAGGGVELMAPELTLVDVAIHLPELQALRGAPAEDRDEEGPVAGALVQERLRFLDAVRGTLAFRLKVVLDLPVIGKRTLDQPVKVKIENGTFDYRALDDGLDWLEGAFLDLGVSDGRFKVGWSVPLMSSKEIISWALAPDALAMAKLNRIPLRVLADVRFGKPAAADGGEAKERGGKDGRADRRAETKGARAETKDGRSETNGGRAETNGGRAETNDGRTETNGGRPPGKDGKNEGKKRLRSMTIADIDVALSMMAPHAVELGGGAILFGGDDSPGIVDLHVEGALVHPPAPGGLIGRIGALDVTMKDVRAGGVVSAFDRLHIDGIEELTRRSSASRRRRR
jgi:hypothetical protein